MGEPNKPKDVEELQALRNEADQLRKSLEEAHREKENWFSKKEAINAEIKKLVEELRKVRGERDAINLQIKGEKQLRGEIQHKAMEEFSKAQQLRQESRHLAEKLHEKSDPHSIREHIAKIEYTIETEVIPFERERELMKKIRHLQTSYQQANLLGNVHQHLHEAFYHGKEKKKEAFYLHKTIQQQAKESQERHEKLISLVRGLKEMSEEEGIMFSKFVEGKKLFLGLQDEYHKTLRALHGIERRFTKRRRAKEDIRRKTEELALKEKSDAVQEKIKKGGKLTTEDLLVFQQVVRLEEQ